jgi:hypothetical protein
MSAHRKSPRHRYPADVRLRLARADAIESYSSLELTLCSLFAILLGTKADLGGIVFFKITATRSRNSIIETLIKRKYGTEFNAYWNSVIKIIGQLDNKRNEVIHWYSGMNLNFARDGRISSATAMLVPPNLWDRKRGSPKLTEKTLNDFTLKCEFAEAAILSFLLYGKGRRIRRKPRAAWRDIFRQPLAYPPPDKHPIRLMWPKQTILIRPLRY